VLSYTGLLLKEYCHSFNIKRFVTKSIFEKKLMKTKEIAMNDES
jgi:hypothetical protein